MSLQSRVARCGRIMRAAKSRGGRKSKDSGTAESVMPQREPIDDMKADVIEIDLSARLPEQVATNVTPWAREMGLPRSRASDRRLRVNAEAAAKQPDVPPGPTPAAPRQSRAPARCTEPSRTTSK